MSKKKLLIYYPESMLKPVGGPAGYLFNLRQGLDTLNKEELPIDVSFYEAVPKSLRDTVKNKDKIPKRLREFRRAVDDIFYEKKAYPLDEKLHQYDMIHFHSIDAMYLCRKTLENYKGTVILTSHSPCAKFKEKLAWLNPFDYKMLKKWVDRIEEMDAYSDELSELGYEYNVDYDIWMMPVVKNLQHFRKWVTSYPFYSNVQKEGVVLYEAA